MKLHPQSENRRRAGLAVVHWFIPGNLRPPGLRSHFVHVTLTKLAEVFMTDDEFEKRLKELSQEQLETLVRLMVKEGLLQDRATAPVVRGSQAGRP